MALLAAVAGAAGKSTTYSGKTAQNKPIKIKGTPTSLSLQSFQIRLLCHDGSLLFANLSGFDPTPLKGGRFADTQYGKTDVVSWSGTVRSGKVAGRVEVENKLKSGMNCVSGPVKFKAKAGG